MKTKITIIIISTMLLLANLTILHSKEVGGIPIFMYHMITDDTPKNPNSEYLYVSPENFDMQLKKMHDSGYKTITFDELSKSIEKDFKLPDKSFIITFDDGYLNNYTEAFPILKKYDYTAYIGITSKVIGDPDIYELEYFNYDQAKEMLESGVIKFTNHTYSHKDLSKLSEEEILFQITKSREDIYNNLGVYTDVLTLPFGYTSQRVQKIIKDEGYKVSMRTTGKIKPVKTKEDLLALYRITITNEHNYNNILDLINSKLK